MSILHLLELHATASEREIYERAVDKQRYFSNLARTAPTPMLAGVYTRRLKEIEDFLASRRPSLEAAAQSPAAAPVPPANRPTQAQFLLAPDAGGDPIELQPGLNILGREPRQMGHPISLNDPYLSKTHAVLEVVSGSPASVYVYDIGEISGKASTNGVQINDGTGRISGRIELRDGDRVRFGQTRFVLRQCVIRTSSSQVAQTGEHIETAPIKRPYR